MKVRYVSFNFGKTRDPNVISNLLPNHLEPKINALMKDPTKGVKTQVDDVKTSMEFIYEELVQAKFHQSKEGKEMKEKGQNEDIHSHYYKYHANLSGHTI